MIGSGSENSLESMLAMQMQTISRTDAKLFRRDGIRDLGASHFRLNLRIIVGKKLSEAFVKTSLRLA